MEPNKLSPKDSKANNDSTEPDLIGGNLFNFGVKLGKNFTK